MGFGAYRLSVDIRLDAYPVNVSTPEGVLARCRLLVVGERALLFQAAGRTVTLSASADVNGVEVGYPTRVELSNGQTWTATPGSGCGCGSPLHRETAQSLLASVDV